jgi:hypothetical protein
MIKNLIAQVKNALFVIRAKYQVVIYMHNAQNKVEIITHYAANYDDALQWFYCYPASDYCEIYESTLGRCALIPVAYRDAGYNY